MQELHKSNLPDLTKAAKLLKPLSFSCKNSGQHFLLTHWLQQLHLACLGTHSKTSCLLQYLHREYKNLTPNLYFTSSLLMSGMKEPGSYGYGSVT